MSSLRLSDVLLHAIGMLGAACLVYYYTEATVSVRAILALVVAKSVFDTFAAYARYSDQAARIKDLEDQIAELGCRVTDLLAESLSRENLKERADSESD